MSMEFVCPTGDKKFVFFTSCSISRDSGATQYYLACRTGGTRTCRTGRTGRTRASPQRSAPRGCPHSASSPAPTGIDCPLSSVTVRNCPYNCSVPRGCPQCTSSPAPTGIFQERYRTAGRVLPRSRDRSVLAYVTGAATTARRAPAKRDRSVNKKKTQTSANDLSLKKNSRHRATLP